jgi:hypothetical protein
MFPGHEQHVAKALFLEREGFALHFLHRQGHAQDRVVARETTVLAIVDALVGKIKRGEEANNFSEALLGQSLGTTAERFQQFTGVRRKQIRKVRQGEMSATKALPHRREIGSLGNLQ